MRFSHPRRRRPMHTIPPAVETCEARTLLTSFGPLLDEVPAIDGVGNNREHPEWGSVGVELRRLAAPDYADGFYEPAGQDRPSPRAISNGIVDASEPKANGRYLTDVLWVWGQFIDHDLDLTEGAHPAESFDIPVPAGDSQFDPFHTGTQVIDLNRSHYAVDGEGVRQQINQITAFLDGSVIYGSDQGRADALRHWAGGKLKTSAGDLLPFNDGQNDEDQTIFPNAGLPQIAPTELFLAGDVRANENVALSAMHTLWVREHNRIAGEIADRDPNLTDEEIYQQARAIVRAELQVITYNEFLPALLGGDALSPYQGYNPAVNPNIANEFSTAAYRFGHSLLSSELLRLDANGEVIENGNLSLQQAFFRPDELIHNGIDSILRGLSSQIAQELDNQIVDDVRNFLFGPPGAGGFDLASLNIQRGRDHGLASYNATREALGLEPVQTFLEITSDPVVAGQLESLYGNVEDMDLWVGGLAEDHLHGSSMGETFTAIIADQFERLRDGDRFWYQNIFQGRQLRELESTSLAEVIQRNTHIEGLQESVFFAPTVLYVDLRVHDATDVTVHIKRETLEVVDHRNHRVIASRSLVGLKRLVLVGSEGHSEQITIGPLPAGSLSEGIEIQAGEGGDDLVRFFGTNQEDTIQVSTNQVAVNGVITQIDGVDRIEIQTCPGDDEVEIDEDVDIPVIVDAPQTPQSHHAPHHLGHPLEEVFGSHEFLDSLYQRGHGRRR